MDITKENYNPNPRDEANFLSKVFFTYTIDMFKMGYQKQLDVDDLYNPLNSDRSALVGDRLERRWDKEVENAKKKKNGRPSLLKALIYTFWPEYLYLGILLLILELVIHLIQPLWLGKLLDFFGVEAKISETEAFWYAGGVVFLNAANAIFTNQHIMSSFHYGMKVRAACCALVYRKSLKLSKTALGETASGKIVNLLSNDVSRFDVVSIFIHYMWVSPLALVFVLYFLWVEAGWAGIAGILTLFSVVPIQGYTGKLSAIYRKQTALKTDERVRLMDEIISGVQVIKMYAWEKPFDAIIRLARKAELKIIMKSSYVRGLYMTFNLFTTRSAMFATLLTMVLMDQQITATKVFVFMSYYNVLGQTIASMFVRGISEIAELVVAIKRLEEFMTNEEYKTTIKVQNGVTDKKVSGTDAVIMDNVTVTWKTASTDLALSGVSMTARRGELVGIIGPVGSGKSSFLQTLLGELEVVSGDMQLNGTTVYASQEPWVFAATIRQNILFGAPFDKKRYNEVVHACALEKDFDQFSNGDNTVVGDRGASLSGGQKARINLARAVYRDADIYLFDDPLSAVDIHVSKHLYDICINQYLANKTRILVTHQVHHLKNADHIIILNNGRIENEGTFQELSNSENLYAKLLTSEPEQNTDEDKKKFEASRRRRGLSISSRRSSISSAITDLGLPDEVIDEDDEDENEEIKMKDMQEDSSKGKIKGSIYWQYLYAGGNVFFVMFVNFLYLLSQAIGSGIDYFVSYWVNVEEFRNHTEILVDGVDTVSNNSIFDFLHNTDEYLYFFGILVLLLFVVALVRSMLFYKLAMNSSQKLHDVMFTNILNAPMRFFDTNPSGRILNRFSKDMGAVDELLPKVILDAAQIILIMFGSLVLVAIINPYFLIMVGIISILFMILRRIFLKSSKNIKRLEGIMRSPVFTHLNATLQGLTTIRAFKAETILTAEFDKHQDCHTSAWFMYIAASSAFGFVLDLICFLFVAVVTFSFLTFSKSLGFKGGEVGLAITQAIGLTGFVQWGIRQSAEVSNQVMSVERVLEYKVLPGEKQPDNPKKLPKTWPDKGLVKFEKMSLTYFKDGPAVIKDLELEILPKEKVGVVGRTGAGKSSLIAALFRLANIEGGINIDEIDTKDLNLQELRSKISIIPQDPVLFSGTLRYNLDPFDEYSDEVLYKAIEDVELKDPANIINRLENRVMDRGANYSVGQRQLICLARAIVRKNKILMLDEATANVDPQTDALIQKTIRKKFADCTVLTVAHRLNTIMDSDKVLVMEFGAMVEFDHPHLLLQKPDGVFNKMVTETGKALSEQLRKIARESYQKQLALPE